MLLKLFCENIFWQISLFLQKMSFDICFYKKDSWQIYLLLKTNIVGQNSFKKKKSFWQNSLKKKKVFDKIVF